MSVNRVDPSTGELSLIAGGTLYADAPIGAIMPYGGATAPSGWLLCQGQAISRIDYSDLFKAIGTAFGTGDGTTTFNIPDLRESVPKGAGLTSNSNTHLDADGLAVGEFIDDRIKTHSVDSSKTDISATHSHTHNVKWNAVSLMVGTVSVPYPAIDGDHAMATTAASTNKVTITDPKHSHTYTGGATTEVKAVGVNYIIKAKQIAIPADFLAKVDEAVEDVYGDIIPSDASASNKLITVADRASFTKTIHTTAKTQSDWHTLGNINVSDIPSGNYLVSLKSSPDVQSQNISCLLQLGSSMIAMSMNGGTTQMLSCPKVINKGSATTLNIALYLGQGSTIQEGDFVIRFDRVN